jgi:alpha-glucosidase
VFTLNCYSIYDLSFKITDVNRTRFEVPQTGIFPIDPSANNSFPLGSSEFLFNYTANPFDFTLTRRFDNEVIFDTRGGNIIFSQYYLEISTQVTSNIVYGFSERFSDSFRLKTGKYTIFNMDRPCAIDSGNGYQTYGYYPAYLVREKSGNFHMNYFRSSNAMDVVV